MSVTNTSTTLELNVLEHDFIKVLFWEYCRDCTDLPVSLVNKFKEWKEEDRSEILEFYENASSKDLEDFIVGVINKL